MRARVKGKKLMMLLTGDYIFFHIWKTRYWLIQLLRQRWAQMLYSSPSKPWRRTGQAQVKAQVCLLNSRAAAELEISQGLLGYLQLLRKFLYRGTSTPAFFFEHLLELLTKPVPMPLANCPTKIDLVRRCIAEKHLFWSCWTGNVIS